MPTPTTTAAIKARPTLYKGVQMRSRLEANYAAELDAEGRRWEYEPACFANEAGQWLPDFGSTFADTGPLAMFTEIKPAGPLAGIGPGRVDAAALDQVDGILRRIAIAWDSRPDALLELVFWEYDVTLPTVPRHAFLHIYSLRRLPYWLAYWGETPAEPVPWPGMKQSAQLDGGR